MAGKSTYTITILGLQIIRITRHWTGNVAVIDQPAAESADSVESGRSEIAIASGKNFANEEQCLV